MKTKSLAKFIRLSILALATLSTPAAIAQQSTTKSIGQCAEIGDSQARLICYDSFMGAGASEPERALPVLQDPVADSASSPAVTEVNSGEVAEFIEVDEFTEVEEKEEAKEAVFASVASLKKRGDGRWIIILSNNQEWIQVSGTRNTGLSVGQDIRIYRSSWGNSFRLKAVDASGFIQVRRLK